ncbi:MAG: hypothetical protein AUH17_03035 [Actinobacteria bacterium 13_2_20CM_68_14]|nr:MAG: hypothetical protein AUH17_03035 [Actinobacteria bacterium 13_2_20CM_68_14]
MIVASPPPLICIDPGHGTPPAIGRQTEPIGPGSGVLKIKDGGGAAGEAVVNLAIAKKTRTLLLARGYRVAMTRTGPVFRYRNGGTNTSLHGFQTLYPAWHKSWTDDIYARSLKAARLVQAAAVQATGAASLGLVKRTDLTGFNWADVPSILVECGFLSNPPERRLLQSSAYEWKLAHGLTAGAAAFTPLR